MGKATVDKTTKTLTRSVVIGRHISIVVGGYRVAITVIDANRGRATLQLEIPEEALLHHPGVDQPKPGRKNTRR